MSPPSVREGEDENEDGSAKPGGGTDVCAYIGFDTSAVRPKSWYCGSLTSSIGGGVHLTGVRSDAGVLTTSESTSGGGEYAGASRCSGTGGKSRPCEGPLSSPPLDVDNGENGGEDPRGGLFPGKYRGMNGCGPRISGLAGRVAASKASRSFSRFALLRRRRQILMKTVNESTARTPTVQPIATANVALFLLEEPLLQR